MTKPQMKNFLMSVYGFNVKKINSLVRMGVRRNEGTSMPRHGKDFKRFYVRLNDYVEIPNVPKSLNVVKGLTEVLEDNGK